MSKDADFGFVQICARNAEKGMGCDAAPSSGNGRKALSCAVRKNELDGQRDGFRDLRNAQDGADRGGISERNPNLSKQQYFVKVRPGTGHRWGLRVCALLCTDWRIGNSDEVGRVTGFFPLRPRRVVKSKVVGKWHSPIRKKAAYPGATGRRHTFACLISCSHARARFLMGSAAMYLRQKGKNGRRSRTKSKHWATNEHE